VTKPVLYISGSPGCGKTALVNSILAASEVELLENNINLVSVNCMALNGLEAVWERLAEELGSQDKRRGKTRSYEIAEKFLSNGASKWSVSAKCRMDSANISVIAPLFLMRLITSLLHRITDTCVSLYP